MNVEPIALAVLFIGCAHHTGASSPPQDTLGASPPSPVVQEPVNQEPVNQEPVNQECDFGATPFGPEASRQPLVAVMVCVTDSTGRMRLAYPGAPVFTGETLQIALYLGVPGRVRIRQIQDNEVSHLWPPSGVGDSDVLVAGRTHLLPSPEWELLLDDHIGELSFAIEVQAKPTAAQALHRGVALRPRQDPSRLIGYFGPAGHAVLILDVSHRARPAR